MSDEPRDSGVYRFAYNGPVMHYPHPFYKEAKRLRLIEADAHAKALAAAEVELRESMEPIKGYMLNVAADIFEAARAFAKEFVEKVKAGDCVALPPLKDSEGKPLWSIEWPDHKMVVDGLQTYPPPTAAAIMCDCGATAARTTHAEWCSAWQTPPSDAKE